LLVLGLIQRRAEEVVVSRNIADQLIDLRAAQELTQEALAEKAGTSPTTISNLESGKVAKPQYRTLRKVAAALGVDVEELMSPKAGTPLPEAGERRSRSPWVRHEERRLDRYEELFRREPGEFNAPLSSLDTAIQFAVNVGTDLARIKDTLRELAAGSSADADEVRELTEVSDRFTGFVDRVDSKVSEMYRAERGEEEAEIIELKLRESARSA
jgi:transcriptional regulator with XRE-family HTH domain